MLKRQISCSVAVFSKYLWTLIQDASEMALSSLLLAIYLVFWSRHVVRGQVTACADDKMDWYEAAVGENPCMLCYNILANLIYLTASTPGQTYEKLRKTCNSACQS